MMYGNKTKEELISLREKLPIVEGNIAIILKPAKKAPPLKENDVFICPPEKSVSLLLIHLRHKIKLDPTQGLYLYINNAILNGNARIGPLYTQYADNGFLIITYALENVFG